MATAATEQKTESLSSQPFPIPASVLPQVAPSTYLLSHLISATPVRPGGRLPTQTRPINLNTGSLTNANGSALVRFGNTSVVCGVRAEILDVRDIPNFRPSNPVTDDRGTKRKRRGGAATEEDTNATTLDDGDSDSEILQHSLLVPNVELQTGASPLSAYQPSSGPPSALAQSLSQRLLSTLLSTRLVRADDLRIYGMNLDDTIDESSSTEGIVSSQVLRGYWTLYIDLLVLSHDGSVFDAALMALVAALKNTKLPKAWYDADREQVVCSPDTQESRSLRLRGKAPVSLSWRVFVNHEDQTKKDQKDSQKWVLLDPDAFEEDSGACPEGGNMVVDQTDSNTTILSLSKSGGPSLGKQDMRQILELAQKRFVEWQAILYDTTQS